MTTDEPLIDTRKVECMTLRDYFAAAALQGLCANPGGPFQANVRSGWGLVNCSTFDIAGSAYDIADAMLEARLK